MFILNILPHRSQLLHSSSERNLSYEAIHGPLFFGSSTTFKALFSPREDPKEVIIDFQHSRVADHSAIDAIKFIADQYMRYNKTLHFSPFKL